MAREFIAPIPPTLNASSLLASLTDMLVSEGLCEIEATEALKSQLRWVGLGRRDDWPEDITFSVHEGGLLLSFHTGTGTQRSLLISRTEALLNGYAGESLTFEEI